MLSAWPCAKVSESAPAARNSGDGLPGKGCEEDSGSVAAGFAAEARNVIGDLREGMAGAR